MKTTTAINTELNKTIVVDFCKQLWEQRRLDVIDELFTPDATIQSPLNIKKGTITMREVAQKWLTAFPDLYIRWMDFLTEGDTVVSRWQAEGTHLGSFFATQPSHQEVFFSGVTFYTVQHSKIVSYWALVDIHTILKQIGVDSLAEAIE